MTLRVERTTESPKRVKKTIEIEVPETEEQQGEGLMSLFGKYITVWCMNYIYNGKLVGVNEHDIKLDEASIVYDTGPHDAKKIAERNINTGG